MSDLDRLIKAVEAGTWDGDMRMPAEWHPTYITQSYYGSLDAALTLMESLLPTGQAIIGTHTPRAHVSLDDGFAITCLSDNPARALLLTVLKAYRETTHDPH